MPKQDVQGPAKDRYLKSYEIRREIHRVSVVNPAAIASAN